jgi:aromatic ring-cleaving dioxygenase
MLQFFFLNEELKEPVPWRQCIKIALCSLVFPKAEDRSQQSTNFASSAWVERVEEVRRVLAENIWT